MSQSCWSYNRKISITYEDDEDWDDIDSKVKSWFYSTVDQNLLYSSVDPNLLQIISRDNCIAKDFWDELDKFFLNNKTSLMLHLQDQFQNMKKGTPPCYKPNVSAHCS